MKKLVILWCACLAIIGAKAQETRWRDLAPEVRAEKLTDWMHEKLQLSEDTTEKVSQINLKYALQLETLNTDDSSRLAKFQKIKSIDESKDQELKKLLSEKQFSQYLDEKEELREKIKNYREG